jgi:hypothetical protein
MIDRRAAEEIARKECEARCWILGEPVKVQWGLFHHEVWGYANRKGGNVIIRVRKRDGKVIHACVTPL